MKHYTAVISGLVVMAIFIAIYTVYGVEPPKQMAYVLLLGVAVGICVSWLPAAVRSIMRGGQDDHDKGILSIWLSWTALVTLALYANSLFWLQRPKWLLESPISLIVVVLMLIAGGYALVAPATGEDVPRREKIWTTFATLIGGVVIGTVFTLMAIYGLRNVFSGG